MRHLLAFNAFIFQILRFHFLFFKNPKIEEKVRSNGENRLDIESILSIAAVDLADTGNISCIGTNEAGVNSSTTYLLVVGKLWPYWHERH